MENYNHIELEQSEIDEAMRLLRKQKHHKIETEKYWDKVREAVEYPKLDKIAIGAIAIKKLKENCKGEFVFDENYARIFNLLCLYFSGDPEFEQDDFSLEKGIFLAGPVGCGKTSLMKGFINNSFNPFGIISTMEVSDSFSKNGVDGILKYHNVIQCYPQQFYGHSELGVCFDDLGTETIKRHYGNESNVMGDIIQARHRNASLMGKTHFTGNVASEDIEEIYGVRVRSRIRELCNFISFDPKTADLRK